MTARNVTRCFIVCDSCGTERVDLSADPTTARITASAEGWRYARFDRWAHGIRKGSPRCWDACPSCDMPATPEEAQRVREERGA